MLRGLRLICALRLLALLVGVLPAAAQGKEAIDLASAVLGETRHVEVNLPASYAWATERRYPVLYLLGVIDGLRALYAGFALPEGLAAEGLAAVEAHYAALSKQLGTPTAVSESALNEVGYALLGRERVAEAIAVFERATRENPSSANAWDSLADALEGGARPDDALAASRRAVELATCVDLPDRASYERHLARLQRQAASAAAPSRH